MRTGPKRRKLCAVGATSLGRRARKGVGSVEKGAGTRVRARRDFEEKEVRMADQELLDRYAPTIDAMETKEAYLLDGELYIRHEFRDPRELQTRMTYHKVGEDNVVSNDNLVMLGVWARAQKQGERVK